MTIRILAAAATTTIAVAATAASGAYGAQTAVKNCGTAAAAGWTFHVGAVNLPNCASARALTKKLARMGLHAKFTPYRGTYLTMHCFGVVGKVAGKSMAQIQCTSSNGRRSLFATAKR